jgi:serine/threonine-protein kinase
MGELGQVQIRSSPALQIPQEAPPPKRGAWMALFSVGLLLLGAGGTLVGVKLLGQQQPQPQQPVAAAALPTQPTPPAPTPTPMPPQAAPTPAPAPAPVVAAPEPAPTVVAKEEPPEPAPPSRKPGKPEKKKPAPAVTKKPEPKPVVVAEAPRPSELPPEPKRTVEIVKPAETGTIAFRIRPYATVLVDGKYLGDTPVAPITVPVGTVTVTLINKDLGKDLKVPFEVKAGQNTFKYNLEE